MSDSPAATILWLRRDLRLADHPGWAAALAGGGPVIPVFLLDPVTERQLGAAPAWRLGQSLADLAGSIRDKGSRLVLRRGDALETLRALIAETGARRVVWSRLYDSASRERDTAVKAALKADGIAAESVNAHLLFEPWEVATKTGSFYKVYTPFWKAVRGADLAEPLVTPPDLAPPGRWPASEDLADWRLEAAMDRGAAIVARHAAVGEAAARGRLGWFTGEAIGRYRAERDRLDRDATSRLSAALSLGEISARTVWHAGWRAAGRLGGGASAAAESFVSELVWREFAYHLLHHTPQIEHRNWRQEWDAFPWAADSDAAERWRQGRTGIEAVDAGMREMYVTGTMHNRARMLVASFLTKHLMVDWRAGEAWFRDCLVDWDPACNAMGWQWAAGTGPDAAPFFRVFNPETQAAKFDPDRRYRDRWIAEGRAAPHEDALSWFGAIPRGWGLSPGDAYPAPVVGLAEGRERALAAYKKLRAA
ncbi:DNA photolyase PhrA [Paralimibaculum aggregatum]|uniref:DNA photolyase PhrA n=1 Tax=Paralimibaculum aggregatum TaxID=3036245 RepID=A0ABQ6LNH8_9RHOB|nr:deoxyribodipyrimidine photo-lyase [Limibaculum sp. NKW23]GMG84723.1 DNA photolyase PhrA [Limibaculum sp. NKW23]